MVAHDGGKKGADPRGCSTSDRSGVKLTFLGRSAILLELWIREGEYFFVDRFSGCPVQVGQAFQEEGAEGPWTIEVNNRFVTAPISKLRSASSWKDTIVLGRLSAGYFDSEEGDASDGFTVVD